MKNIWETAQSYSNYYLGSFWSGSNQIEIQSEAGFGNLSDSPQTTTPSFSFNSALGAVAQTLFSGIQYLIDHPVQALTMGLALQAMGVNADKRQMDPSQVPISSNILNFALLGSYDTPGRTLGLTISGNVAYVADEFFGLQIIDVNNSMAPTLLGNYNTPGAALGVAIVDNVAYVADRDFGLQIINVSNPLQPTLLGNYTLLDSANGVTVSGNVAYVAGGSSGLQIINVSNPLQPTLLGNYDTPGIASDIVVSGNVAYVADFASGLQIINVSNPMLPTLLGNYDTPGFVRDVALSGNLVYLADDTPGLQIISVSNPLVPTLLGNYNTPDIAIGVVVSGNVVYVADVASGLQIINVTNPLLPALLGNYDTPGAAFDVTVSGNIAYVTDGASGLEIIQTDFTPVLTINRFNITQGQSLRLDSSHLAAIDRDSNEDALIFIMSSVQQGRFQNTFSNIEITFFTQQQLLNGEIAFIHDDSQVEPSYQISVSDGIVRTVPMDAQIDFVLRSNSVNTSAIVGGILGGLFALCYLVAALAGIYAYRKYQQKRQDAQELELELGEQQENYHDTANVQASARKLAGRYQIFDKTVPEHLQSEYAKRIGFKARDKAESLGKGNFGETWVAYDEKAPENSVYQFLAVKKVKSAKHFKEKLREAEVQRVINGVDLHFVQQANAYEILSAAFLDNETKQQQLKFKPNCFYLIPHKKKNQYELAYLNQQGEIQCAAIAEESSLKRLKQQLRKFSAKGLEAIFERQPCSYQLDEQNDFQDLEKLIKRLTKELKSLTYSVCKDETVSEQWRVYYKHPNGELQAKDIHQETELLQALNQSQHNKLQELFTAYHEKEHHYEKNRLLRLITNKVPFENFINLDNHIMPVLDYFIQEDELYILSMLAPRNGEVIKSLLANPEINPLLKEQWLIFIAHDLLKAVSYLHSLNYIHHDIKPDNMVFNEKGEMLLIDFGETEKCPQAIGPQQNLKGKYLKGHIAYNPPETLPINQKGNALLNGQLQDLSAIQSYFFKKETWAVGATLLAYCLGQSNPFAIHPEQVNPADSGEWNQACSHLGAKGTFEHFATKIKSTLENVPESSLTPFFSLLKNLLTVRVENRAQDIQQSKEQLEKSYGGLLQEPTKRPELFQTLIQGKVEPKFISAPTVKGGNAYHMSVGNNPNAMFGSKILSKNSLTIDPSAYNNEEKKGAYFD